MSNSPMNANEKKVSANPAQDASKTSQDKSSQGNKDAHAKPDANAQKTDAMKTDANAPAKKAS